MTGKKSAIVLVIDGMADLPHPEKGGGKTPMEIANTPNMDRLAKEGHVGYIHSIGPWQIGGSDTSHVGLLGYDPFKGYTGRGPIEVAGTGVDLKPGDVSIRCNYCTVNGDMNVLNRTASYVREGVEQLAKALNDGITLSDERVSVEFRNSADYRCVVYFRGPGISANISDMDPSYDIIVDSPSLKEHLKKNPKIVDCKPKDTTPEAQHMADLLNEWVKKGNEILDNHPVNLERKEKGLPPANCIMPRGAGETPTYQEFQDKWHLKGACVAGTGLIKGIGKLTGMYIPDVPGATGYIDTDLMSKANVTLQCLKDGYEFILIHIEGTDEVSHDGLFDIKTKAIEDCDEMVGYLMKEIPRDTVLCILSDHSTPCVAGDHTADPSPIVFWSPDETLMVPDRLSSFVERNACKGSLKHLDGKDLIPLLLNYMDRSMKFGS
ncbi:MAG: 2,3-bisphosphoglycerate-independent phosphoglycerate mutase [Candidatus Hodarchaeota archaeon]